ncbi:hypothetical protein Adeg_1719 [Ammonifex degensii KC4]|uniref:Type 4 fimbrial biogenesis protein PilX N-terminal domain-containing protein n=1 Tax=Ammonifex degensii (strain DSM 10501 / KC4) TaxID=429009 RepID=C9R932_AMMDK|nr:pilus assembly PilX N-terminal domain-containing protein [Ammonifex degensii]ACX52811.1 hypothetical protein Adeg_1719 [Ammonifex degensii KC4]
MKSWCDERGQALALVLILSVVLFITGTAAVAAALQHSRLVTLEEAREKAYYIAEAGVEKALANLKQRLVYPAPGFENFTIDNEPYAGGLIEKVKVSKETVGETIYYTITSTGCYPESPIAGSSFARKTITAKVKVCPDPFLAYGGPGLKSDTAVHLTGGVTSTGGSLLARTGDVKSQALIAGNIGGIYAGRNVHLTGAGTTGSGEIKAGRDVYLSAAISTWSGEIWAGNKVHGPWWQLGKVTVHENCGPNIPGFPLPSFPVVDKGSDWYKRVKAEAQSRGYYFSSAAAWLDDDPDFGTGKGIIWDWTAVEIPLLNRVVVTVTGATLKLEDPARPEFLAVVDGPLTLDFKAYKDAYARWRDRIKSRYRGKTVTFIDLNLGRLRVTAEKPATIVADSIKIDESLAGLFGVDTEGIKKPFGLFAVAGDVVYRAVVGSGGRLSVIATGKFDCATAGNLNLDWVAAKGDVLINALINLNAAQTAVPPGTPVGYQIVSWSVE